MLIKYVGNYETLESIKRSKESCLLLKQDNWDDFTYKTFFQTSFLVNGEEIEIDSIRILIEGQKTAYSYLNQLIQEGWNAEFPLPDTNYISVPSSVEFYKVIEGKLGKETALEAAKALKDAGYMLNVMKDEGSYKLSQTEGFSSSLQRESGAIKAFEDGWRFLERIQTRIDDFSFKFILRQKDQPIKINFNLNSSILPYDINILVGPNGVGKSQALQNLVESLLKIERCTTAKLEKQNLVPFENRPTVSQIIVISYSPFEQFILDIEKYDLVDKDVYRYFGFRKRRISEGGKTSIGLSRNRPAQDSVDSLLKCILEDQKFSYRSDWVNKVITANTILNEAINYDKLAIELHEGAVADNIYDDTIFSAAPIIELNKKLYIPINKEVIHNINIDRAVNFVNKLRGVVFLKDDDVVELSSGQRLFSYIVINILGTIRNNSLILIDEPELFLHPNLEISYLALLKSVLEYFASKAVIATHSLIAVREVPRKCVHVLMQTEAGTIAVNPPFETFGGDMQRISSYVFGDKSVTKPFQDWLAKKVEELGSPQNVIDTLGTEINEETIMFLRSMEQ